MEPVERITESVSLNEYVERVKGRLSQALDAKNCAAQAWFLARSAEDHFARLELPWRRYLRAREQKDLASIAYERRLMLALMYEIADTAYLVMNMLDFKRLELESSADGYGLAGESATDVVKTLGYLNDQCGKLISFENRLGLRLDFKDPVDEKEGLTFNKHRHWQDFVVGSASDSFYRYFADARLILTQRLNAAPKFWAHQTVRQYLQNKGYRALYEILRRLEQASIDLSALAGKEKEMKVSHIWRNFHIKAIQKSAP